MSACSSKAANLIASLIRCCTGSEWTALDASANLQRKQVQQLYGINDILDGRPNLFAMAAVVLAYPPHILQANFWHSYSVDCSCTIIHAKVRRQLQHTHQLQNRRY